LWLALSVRIATAVVLVVAGCSSGNNDRSETSRVGSCTDRLLERASANGSPDQVRRYVETAYCAPFAKRGWVYENGTLSLDAYKYVQNGGRCAEGGSGEPSRTVPCEEVDPSGPLILDCAILHLVPRAEVKPYVAKLRRQREVRCDDGTPLSGVGASSSSRGPSAAPRVTAHA
jgi:hypothetical protein